MNYQQTIDYLFDQLPMFHRIGAPAYKANLTNTKIICRLLGNPEKKFPSIHIAGTNGKGSVSNMISAVLQTAGYKTGLYTSPHLLDFRERIRINGKKIPKGKVIEFVKSNKQSFESFQPSFFEYTFGMAMQYFADEPVDIAVVETGMGGRLDSTNVVNSILSVITNIGYDHTQFLGNTLEKIATEKAGIIKKDVPVIIGETQEGVLNVFLKTAQVRGAQLICADKNFCYVNERKQSGDLTRISLDVMKMGKPYLTSLKCDLTGNYQFKNIITVMQVFDTLQSLGYSITEEHLFSGMANVKKLTGFQGRWEIIGNDPLIICDTAHNSDGLREVMLQLDSIPCGSLHVVVGFVKDKDIKEILPLFPRKAQYYICKANIPRGLDQNELMLMCKNAGLKGQSFGSVKEAFNSARQQAHKEDLIFIGGSTFVVAEVI